MELMKDSYCKILFSAEDYQIIKSAYSRFHDYNDGLRCNIFSLLCREVLRIAISRNAPDHEVVNSWWFDPSINDGKPTRRDRYRYSLIGNIGKQVIDAHQELDVDEDCSELVKLNSDLSKFAHISSGTRDLDNAAGEAYLKRVEDCILSFAKRYHDVRKYVKDEIWIIVQESIEDEIYQNFPSELDELSSHTYFESASVDEIEEIKIESQIIFVIGNGTVEVELNYGKGEDGFSAPDDFPFDFVAKINVNDLSVARVEFKIDNSSFYK